MGWNQAQKWLDNADLPFRHMFGAGDEDLYFRDIYPHFFDMLFRVARNFIIIDGMPETWYKPFVMATIIINGKICAFRRVNEENTNGDLVALNCAQAAEPDLYYVPSKVLVVNPRFIAGESYNLTPGVDCEVVYCTSQDMYRYGTCTGGLYSLIDLTARLLTHNTISLFSAMKNTRLTTAFAADDQITVASIEAVLKDMYNGAPYKVVQKTLIDQIEKLPLQSDGAQQTMLQLLETHKYILSEFYAAIGIDEPQQMKRERLVTAEVEQGAELPVFNVFDILESIREGIERVNQMFGTKMTVRINPLILDSLTPQEGAENEQSETEPGESTAGADAVQLPPAGDPVADTPAENDGQPDGAQPSPPEPVEPEQEEEQEPETVTEAAADIIQTAAEIIKMEGGGDDADNGQESSDSGQAGEIRNDSDS